MVSTATVAFNVGGKRCDVSQTLLNMYSTSLLTRMASKEWKDTEEATPLFIERSPDMVDYVLQFMRSKKVTLPESVARQAFLDELEFYCIDVPSEADEAILHEFQSPFVLRKAVAHYDGELHRHKSRKQAAWDKYMAEKVAGTIAQVFSHSRFVLPLSMGVQWQESESYPEKRPLLLSSSRAHEKAALINHALVPFHLELELTKEYQAIIRAGVENHDENSAIVSNRKRARCNEEPKDLDI